MRSDKIRLAIILGSTRQGRFCTTVTDWASRLIGHDERFELAIVDPVDLPLSSWAELQESRGAPALCQQLGIADAFVVVTPEYNHSFSASLKAVIDMAYEEWQAKPVGFISYGGASGGLRAVEQLRQVFAELHAVSIRDSVSFANAARLFHDAKSDPALLTAAQRSLRRMLSRLHWWATALREARRQDPYMRVVGLSSSIEPPSLNVVPALCHENPEVAVNGEPG